MTIRVMAAAVRGEVGRYWHTAALAAASVASAVAFALPVTALHGRLVPAPLRGGELGLTWRAGVSSAAAVQQQAADELGALLVASALATLAIAAVTILMLSLVRESERTPEVAVRRAVGASRGILVGSALLEGATTMALGLAVGAGVAVALGIGARGWPGSLRPGTMLLAAAGTAGLLAVVLAGTVFPVLFPKRRITDAEPPSAAPLTPSVLQIGASLVALTMGLSLGRHAADSGAFTARADGARAVYAVSVPDSSPAERAQRYGDLLEALESGEGTAASLTSPGALHGIGPVGTVTTDCGQCSEGGLPIKWRVKAAAHRFVSADTFQMLGVRVVEGRGITRGDTWGSPRVAVINRSLAAREFQNGQPIGRGIRVVDDGDQWSTVVGVVDDPPPSAFGAGVQPRYTVYLSVLQYPPSTVDLLTRRADARVRRAAVTLGLGGLDLHALDPRALLQRERAPLAWFASRFAVQGWVMLAIAALGTLAMMRLWVSSMLVELGVRRAMGARRRAIVGHVFARAATVGVAGVVMGAWIGQSVWSALAGLAPGLDPWDGALVLRLGALLVASGLLGALPPALRAARATPASLLGAS